MERGTCRSQSGLLRWMSSSTNTCICVTTIITNTIVTHKFPLDVAAADTSASTLPAKSRESTPQQSNPKYDSIQKKDISGTSQLSNPIQIEHNQVVAVHNPLLIIETNPIVTVLTKLALPHLEMNTYK